MHQYELITAPLIVTTEMLLILMSLYLAADSQCRRFLSTHALSLWCQDLHIQFWLCPLYAASVELQMMFVKIDMQIQK